MPSFKDLEKKYMLVLEENRRLHNDLLRAKSIMNAANVLLEKLNKKYKGAVDKMLKEMNNDGANECPTSESTQEKAEQSQSSQVTTS